MILPVLDCTAIFKRRNISYDFRMICCVKRIEFFFKRNVSLSLNSYEESNNLFGILFKICRISFHDRNSSFSVAMERAITLI